MFCLKLVIGTDSVTLTVQTFVSTLVDSTLICTAHLFQGKVTQSLPLSHNTISASLSSSMTSRAAVIKVMLAVIKWFTLQSGLISICIAFYGVVSSRVIVGDRINLYRFFEVKILLLLFKLATLVS